MVWSNIWPWVSTPRRRSAKSEAVKFPEALARRLEAALDRYSIRLAVQRGNDIALMTVDPRMLAGAEMGKVLKIRRGTLTKIADDGWVQWEFKPSARFQQLQGAMRRLSARLARLASDQAETES